MSIWGSIGISDPTIVGLDYDDEDAHYKGIGEPCITIDVATTWHDHARLSLSGDHLDAEVLLPPEELRRLADYLIQAAEHCEKERQDEKTDDWRKQAERVQAWHQREAEENKRYLEAVFAKFRTNA